MLSNKLSSIVIPAIGLALLTCDMARANLVTNGGFELYSGSAPKDYFTNVLPTDWSGGLFDFIDASGTADSQLLPITRVSRLPGHQPPGRQFRPDG